MSDFKRYFLLNEISESNLKLIASNIPPEDLPFNNIFGDKYRIEEEFIAVHPIISQLQNSFKG